MVVSATFGFCSLFVTTRLISTRGGGGAPHMEWTGMLVVPLRVINFGFWSRLGCSGQNVIILAVRVSLRVAREEITKQKEF